MTFSVLFTISSWLTAFSCFSLWVLESSDILSLHSQSKIPFFGFFLAHSNCVKRLSIHFSQEMEPCWGSSRSAAEWSLWAGRMHPLLLMPSSFNSLKGGLHKTRLIHKCSSFISGKGACLWFVVVVVVVVFKGKTKQRSLMEHQDSNAEFLSISPPWSNTQRFVPLLRSC